MRGLYYQPGFLSEGDRQAILRWISTIRPLWEYRFSTVRPLPEGETQRMLLRPVYWLGAWQFACLHYYRPPKLTQNRCVKAEPFPPVLAALVKKMEKVARRSFPASEIPNGWKLNTCLVNFYGSKVTEARKVDAARVGEHKDFEPGPVGSLSLGDRAFFQFVKSERRHSSTRVVFQQWLEDRSLQMFSGPVFKEQLFHRVQRVENKLRPNFGIHVEGFETRRVNFTFRYVPERDIIPYQQLPREVRTDVAGYMDSLASHSSFFARECKAPCADPGTRV